MAHPGSRGVVVAVTAAQVGLANIEDDQEAGLPSAALNDPESERRGSRGAAARQPDGEVRDGNGEDTGMRAHVPPGRAPGGQMNALAHAHAPFRGRTQASEALPFATIEIRASVAVIRLELPSPGLWDAQEQQLFITSLIDLGTRGDLTAIVVQGADVFVEGPGATTPDFRAVVEAVAG